MKTRTVGHLQRPVQTPASTWTIERLVIRSFLFVEEQLEGADRLGEERALVVVA